MFGLSLSSLMLIIIMVSLSASALLIWYWAKKDGQFDDVEGVKYRMLEDDESMFRDNQRELPNT